MDGVVYKIAGREEWDAARDAGVYLGSAHDMRDGFIHLSTAAQARATAAKHFARRDDLRLVAVESARLGAGLRWEPSRGGALFPHLYAPLPLSAVLWVKLLPLGPDGAHVFPAGFDGGAT